MWYLPNIFGYGTFFPGVSPGTIYRYVDNKLDVLVWRSIDLALKLKSKVFMNLYIYFDAS